MRHEPSALVRYSEHPVKLVGAHALLAGTQEMERHQPLIQSDMAALHQRPGRDREILPAFLLGAAIPAGLIFELVGVVYRAAVRANRAIRPTLGFQPIPRCLMARKVRVGFVESGP